MRNRVIVVGSANADLVVAVDRRPGAGETVLGADTVVLPGGKGANTAVAAGKLGARVALFGAVGTDAHGQLLLDSLRNAGVDTALVRTVDRPTGIAYITVTPDGENSIIVSPGANSAVADIEPTMLDTAAVVVGSLEIPLPVVEHAMAAAAAHGARPVLNLSPATEVSAATLAVLDPLVVNEHEASWLLGGRTGAATELATELRTLGPRSVLITLGARGAVVADDQGTIEVPAPSVRAVDTTGAGDAFAGALAAALAGGAGLAEAARQASRVAAISVTKPGAQPSYPLASELGNAGT
ncbi:ribokinase [Tamaricihabitans halophyticus]|uniref:ribokinase n=1 Tax=Tamaricihabitans halophyticus TaxID=1262583 RepID=UPI00140517B2|nr:ribokinase [Tamaricihabitans halophyticus]